MSAVGLRFLLLLDAAVEDAPIRAALPPAAVVEVARLEGAATGELVERARPDIVLIGCSAHSDVALQAIAEISGEHRCPTVVLYEGTPNGFMEEAFGVGADDLIVLPQPPLQLAFALEKAVARRRGAGSVAAAPLIAVLGPKGGTGKTLTTCNLAVALAQAGARPVVVDIDLQFGDVGLALGLQPTQTIYDLATAGGTLDAGKVESYLVTHESGARVLLAPTRPDQAAAIRVDFLQRVFELLRSRHDFVIVDTPPAFSPEVIAAIDASSDLCVVGMLDALSLKDTKIGFETLRQMGFAPEETVLVLNRADSSVGIGLGDVEKLLGKAPDVLVPSDRAVPRALTSGRVIVEAEPKSGPARAFTELAARYLAGAGGRTESDSDAATTVERAPRRLALIRRVA